MSILDAVILGALQGLTEFLPISSSGHLVLAEKLMNLPAENLKSFDIAVHFGTLLAIFVYFWKDIVSLWKAFLVFVFKMFKIGAHGGAAETNHQIVASQKLLSYLIIGSIPAIFVAIFFDEWIDVHFRNPYSIAILMIVVGILFFVAEFIYSKVQKKEITMPEGTLMGVAQALALIPGVSRSGITISAGITQGIKREEAARFSFLLGAIAIVGATVFAIVGVLKGKYVMPSTDILIVGIASSFVFGLAAVAFLMRFLKKHTLHIFGVYRVILGFVLLYLLQFSNLF